MFYYVMIVCLCTTTKYTTKNVLLCKIKIVNLPSSVVVQQVLQKLYDLSISTSKWKKLMTIVNISRAWREQITPVGHEYLSKHETENSDIMKGNTVGIIVWTSKSNITQKNYWLTQLVWNKIPGLIIVLDFTIVITTTIRASSCSRTNFKRQKKANHVF